MQGLPPLTARRFRTGRHCLDFAHTGGDGTLAVFEMLHQPADVIRWLGVILNVERIKADGTDLSAVRALRRAIWDAAHSIMSSGQIRRTDRQLLNTVAGQPPMIPKLGPTGYAASVLPVTVGQALSTLARDAIDLFGGALAGRIRACAADDCSLLFVDQSRPGERRWCSMQRCGNRAKVHAHRSHRQVVR